MYRHFLKRVFDLVGSIVLFPFVIPIIIIFGLLIKIEDRGPMLYVSNRLGKNGKAFNMYKLRSMKVNAPEIRSEDGSTFCSAYDERLTKWGKFVREKSIDELPQLLNILIGNMSFIGPRPNLSPINDEKLSQIEKERVNVLPGITGYNQAYYRNSVIINQKFRNDIYYVEHIGLLLDAKIFFKTILSVFKTKNIYIE